MTLRPEDNVVNDIGVSQNGTYLASVGSKINVWDLNSLDLVRSWELDSVASLIKLSPSGDLLVTVHEDNIIRVWQQETGFKVADLVHDHSISAIALSPDGSTLASADITGHMRIWDIKTGKNIFSIEDVLRVNTLSFSPDGLYLASSGIAADDVNNTVQIWETRYYTVVLSLPGHAAVVNRALFSKDGRQVVTASRDNTIRVWDVRSGSALRTFRGHTDDVVNAVFSDKGFWLVSAALDNKINIWSFPDGRIIKVLNVPYLKAQTLEYVSNRNWIAVVSGGQGIQIWASSGFTYQPWTDVRDRVTRLYQDRQQVLQIPFIPKPQLPSVRTLRKSVFESQLTFVTRVSQVYGQRINAAIVNYRRQVDQRNRKVAALRQNQRQNRELVNDQLRNIAVRTTRRVLGETVLFPLQVDNLPAYDPDRELMTMRISFTRAFFRQNLIMKMPEGQPARFFYNDLLEGRVVGTAVFDFVSNARVRLSHVVINWQDRRFVAYPVKKTSGHRLIPEEVRAILLDDKQLLFQRYDIPYTNFNDFIRTILREQLKEEVLVKSQPSEVPREVVEKVPVFEDRNEQRQSGQSIQ